MTASPEPNQHAPLAIVMAALANGSAWLQSWAQANISTGALVTFLTIALPAVVSAFIIILEKFNQKVVPLYFDFIVKRDLARSQTLGGQMERLNRNLEDSKGLAESQRRLADIAKEQADRLQDMYEDSERRNAQQAAANASLTASVADIKDSLAKARDSLHSMRDESGGYRLQAETVQAELDEYKKRLGPVIEQVAAVQVVLDANQTKVDQVADFGVKVAEAATNLPRAPGP
jgi:DNA repair exonuclease SbcCD ATPase subunit